jgi:hypothetical protein
MLVLHNVPAQMVEYRALAEFEARYITLPLDDYLWFSGHFMLITEQGIPHVYERFAARPHDVQLLPDSLGDAFDLIALGDKGFIADPIQAELLDAQNVLLVTYRRNNQKKQNTPLEQWALHAYRRLIETVFSQLQRHMHFQNTDAKTDVGLIMRLIGIVTADTLGI